MTINNYIFPKTYQVQELQQERIQLLTVTEIKQQDLSADLRQALLNPNSRFNQVIEDCQESGCYTSVSSSGSYCNSHQYSNCNYCFITISRGQSYCSSHINQCNSCSSRIVYFASLCDYCANRQREVERLAEQANQNNATIIETDKSKDYSLNVNRNGIKASWYDEINVGESGVWKFGSLSTEGEAKLKSEVSVNQEFSYSSFRVKDDDKDLRILSVSAGGEASIGVEAVNAEIRAGVDLASVKTYGINVRTGVQFDTGFKADESGISTSIAGNGISLGKKTGIKTTFLEASVDFEEMAEKIDENCVNQ